MKQRYYLSSGTVQAFVCGFSYDTVPPPGIYHFGRPQYDSAKPIVSDSIRTQAMRVIDALNAGTMTEADACKELDKITW